MGKQERGCAGTGLTWGSEQDLTPSFSEKEICFARTNHWHAFFISVIIPKKGCVKHSDICYLWGNCTKGEGRRGAELNGSSCWCSVLPPN